MKMPSEPAPELWFYIGPEGAAARPAVRFSRAVPPEQRASILAAMAGLPRLVKRRGPTVEHNGRAVLEARTEAPAKRPWIVRYYFESMGGEQLAAEFGGLTEAEVATFSAGCDAEAWSVKRPRSLHCTGLVESDALAKSYPAAVGTCAAETWCPCRGSGFVEKPAPTLRAGVRLVVFPSEQRVERALVSVIEPDALAYCDGI